MSLTRSHSPTSTLAGDDQHMKGSSPSQTAEEESHVGDSCNCEKGDERKVSQRKRERKNGKQTRGRLEQLPDNPLHHTHIYCIVLQNRTVDDVASLDAVEVERKESVHLFGEEERKNGALPGMLASILLEVVAKLADCLVIIGASSVKVFLLHSESVGDLSFPDPVDHDDDFFDGRLQEGDVLEMSADW
jgi:hypothetical protein